MGSCYAGLNAQPARARAFTITHAAHDLRQLILRHQDGKPVYVLGVSYGTQLVLRALQIGRLPLAGLVLDSLVPMETAERWDLSRRVLAASAREPARLAGVPGGSLPRFLGRLLDMPALRARIPWLLRELNGPDGKPGAELARITEELARAGAALGGHPQSPPSIPLVSMVSASENNLRPGLTRAALAAEEAGLLFDSPLPGLLLEPGLPLYARDAYFGGHPVWLPPMLVLSGTRDPKTHHAGALEHVAVLRGAGRVTLVEVAGAPHFILWVAPGCFERRVGAFVQARTRWTAATSSSGETGLFSTGTPARCSLHSPA